VIPLAVPVRVTDYVDSQQGVVVRVSYKSGVSRLASGVSAGDKKKGRERVLAARIPRLAIRPGDDP
jgi:hypothetical protein